MKRTTFSKLGPKVVLGVAAHPDDLDYGAGGTLAQFSAAGAEVHYLILTDGGKGTADKTTKPGALTEIRRQEQRAALKVLGGKTVQFLDYPDGHLEVTMDLKKDIVQVIRQLKPDVVVTIDPTFAYAADFGLINHPDHRAAGQATLDAVFPLARDCHAFPELCDAGMEPHNTSSILLINLAQSNYCVDITDTFETKLAALAAHTSQMKDKASLKHRLERMALMAGKQLGCRCGEAFMRIDITD